VKTYITLHFYYWYCCGNAY